MRFVVAFLVMFMTWPVIDLKPANAAWYFRNYCGWDISSRCAHKRAETARTGRSMPRASTCFGRSC
jgi:hypothetical protein